MDIIVSDFDDTLFKRNHGLIGKNVRYLEGRNLSVYILTYRDEDQMDFIIKTLSDSSLDIIGIGFAGSRKKDVTTKVTLMNIISGKYNVVEALDDDERVVLEYKALGINARVV